MTCDVIDAARGAADDEGMTPQPGPHTGFWGSYALALIDDLRVGPDIVEYLEHIEATLHPFGGRFLVHGAPWQQVEGDAIGDPVLIGFPDAAGAAQWFASAAYRRLAPLRTANSVSRVLLLQGVGPDHRSRGVIEQLT